MTYNLVEIQKRQESTDKFVQKVGKTLWHYTSFPALDGILRKKEIWFGSATNVNDAKEVIGFIDNLKQNIENGLTQNNIKPKCDVDKIFKEIYDRTSQKHLFMFCLSQALHNLLYYHGMIIGEQYYTQETRDHELYKLLSSYISTGILEGFSNLDGFIDNLALCALIHKHPTFTAEKEIRIAPYFVTDNDSNIEYKTFNIIKEFYILDLQKVLETENMHREDIINSIIIGPRSSQNPKDLENYCRHLGLHKLAQNIKVSDCPLR